MFGLDYIWHGDGEREKKKRNEEKKIFYLTDKCVWFCENYFFPKF